MTLADYFYSPAVAVPFQLQLGEYWTSTPYAPDPSHAWRVDFSQGAPLDRSATDFLRVRCVRMGAEHPNGPDVRFDGSKAGSPLITDHETGLMWEAAPSFNGTYAQADTHCKSRYVNGLGGFRLPTIHELHSIVDDRRTNPALDPRFTTSGVVWSSTKRAGGVEPFYWAIDDYDGHLISRGVADRHHARCVK